jgi:sugar (pentulose or hexulose) kinase
MTLPRSVAVIDIGKTNAKLALIDGATGQQIDSRSTPNSVVTSGIYPHADVERLWQFILEGLQTLHAAHGVDGISITTHGATAALMAGEELSLPVLDYEHAGPQETRAEYDAVRPEFSESLSPRLPNGLNLGAQIFWQAKRFPKEFAAATAILTYPQYWAFRLTGIAASEATSLGCHTDLWAPARTDFSSLVAELGWRSKFPPLRPAISVLGPMSAEIVARTGLPPSTPVTCGIHDSNASLVPYLSGDAPLTIISSGTWTIAMTLSGDVSQLDKVRDSLANVDALGRAVPTARFMGGREFDLLVPQIVTPTPADIEKVIDQDIRIQPSFTPGVGPFPNGQGRWTVAPELLSDGVRNAAATLYLALLTQSSLSLCGIGKKIIIEGPLARNAFYGELLVALTGVPVRGSADATGTSLGASMLFGTSSLAKHQGIVRSSFQMPGLNAYVARWQADNA